MIAAAVTFAVASALLGFGRGEPAADALGPDEETAVRPDEERAIDPDETLDKSAKQEV